MIKVGLTGNIGSGKSTVSRIFEVLRIPVYHADHEAKKFLANAGVIASLANEFGSDIVDKNEVNRKKLAHIVFQNPGALKFLNNLIHPLVRNDLHRWLNCYENHNYIVHEAAILFESGFYKDFDRIITVVCPVETAVLRVMDRDSLTREDILVRMKNQWDQEKKKELSDFIIDNGGNVSLIKQVLEIHSELMGNIKGR
jgi:dephospho-CoA kinase